MIKERKRILWRFVIVIFFISFFIYGIISFKDYGISWDEPVQRLHGLVNLKYILKLILGKDRIPAALSNIAELDTYAYKYYGVGIKIPLMLYELLNGFSLSNQQIYNANHLYTFILFFISTLYIYRISVLLKFDYTLSFLSIVLYTICPRITADAFYNIKDCVFLSLFVVELFYSLAVIENQKKSYSIGLIISSAFCINTRYVGAVPILVSAGVLLYKNRDLFFKYLKYVFIIVISTFLLYVAITPASWSNPVSYIINLLITFSDYPHVSTEIIGGRTYLSDDLPWYYLIQCMVLTLPTIYWFFASGGIVVQVRRLFRGQSCDERADLFVNMVLFEFLLFLILDAVVKPTKYNMWRHFYFLHCYIIILSAVFMQYIIDRIKRKACLYYSFIGVVSFSIIAIMVWDIQNHPYEYVYFNHLFSEETKMTKADYWHTSDIGLLRRNSTPLSKDVYPDVNSNIFFGENGWEQYHTVDEKFSAQYMLRDSFDDLVVEKSDYCLQEDHEQLDDQLESQRTEADIIKKLYTPIDDIQVDNQKIVSLLERNHYLDVSSAFVYDSGSAVPVLSNDLIEWNMYEDDATCTYEMVNNSSKKVVEIDLFSKISFAYENLDVSMTENGTDWDLLDDEYILKQDNELFVMIPDSYIVEKVKITFKLSHKDFSYIKDNGQMSLFTRVFYSSEPEISYVECSHNADASFAMLDNDISTKWSSGIEQEEGMYVEVHFDELYLVKRIIMDYGENTNEHPNRIDIFGKVEGEWQKLEFTFDDNKNIILKQPMNLSGFRISINKVNAGQQWFIAELKFITESPYGWSLIDTKDNIISIESNYNNEACYNMIDDATASWNSVAPQSADMEIILNVKEDCKLYGLHLYTKDPFSSGRQIEILGSEDGSEWERIECHFLTPYNFIFDNECAYTWYKIKQIGEDNRNSWDIRDMGLITQIYGS